MTREDQIEAATAQFQKLKKACGLNDPMVLGTLNHDTHELYPLLYLRELVLSLDNGQVVIDWAIMMHGILSGGVYPFYLGYFEG
ncbi:MAG TPA: hypothetical protein ENH82_16540 [bacterium]|nr:hypothetical protein [bacterium]